jgi:hypothetical protein
MELDGQDPSQDRISGHISLVGLKRRRSSLFNPKEPLQPSVTWKVHGDHSWSVLHTDGSETTLAYKKQGVSISKMLAQFYNKLIFFITRIDCFG